MSRRKPSAGEAIVALVNAPASERMALIWKAIRDHAHGDQQASAFLTLVGRTMKFVPAKRPRARASGRGTRP